MSYQTNPILNRLKVIKGWKNPYLPTKTLNYSRDISLWFKVYLLLKLFLNLKKIQLLSCEIRFEQQNKKLLYLVINKKKTQKKKRKKKRISLKRIKTPIRKRMNLHSMSYLYQNVTFLKRNSFWNQNAVRKKILSKFWLTKPKFTTWLNTLEKVITLRQTALTKHKNFNPVKHIKLQFYTNKQKQLLAQKSRIKKINLILYAKLFEFSQQKKSQLLQKFIANLKKKIDKNKIAIQQINSLYAILLLLHQNPSVKKKEQNFFKRRIFNQLQRKKLSLLLKLFKTKFRSLNRTRFLKKKFPIFLLKINKKLLPYISEGSFKKVFLFKNILQLNSLVAQMQTKNFLTQNYSMLSNFNCEIEKKKKIIHQTNIFLENLYLRTFLKSKFRKSTRKKQFQYKFYRIYIWLLLRLKKKRKKNFYKRIHKSLQFQTKSQAFNKDLFCLKKSKMKFLFAKKLKEINSSVKRKQIVSTYKYRLPYRKSYFNFLQFNTKLKLKYFIQDFVQKYFSLHVEAKIVHFLNAYKNQNYFRLVFPIWKKKKNQQIRKFRQKTWKQKQIFLTSQLNVVTTKKNNQQAQSRSNLVKSLKKKDIFLLSRKKIKKLRIKRSFKRIKGSKDFRHSFKYFIPTLMYFSRTLDPQPLAELLSKVLYKAKKQTWMLSTIKDLLKMIPLGRNVGYKIALAGRINSSDKSRLIYITRKNVPLQVFDKNMNFAYSQAKARIGVFGIKIWVYF